jgi:hypothetical protein
MTLPFALPDWLPWWVPVLIVIPALLYAIVFLLMPFSVFGVKGRLDLIDARLDEIQGEIRSLSLRLPEEHGVRPPVPPASADALLRRAREEPPEERRRPAGPDRAEPRLDWPR